MWLCTQHGFYSIVQKAPGEWHVRARVRQDLENLRALCATKAPPTVQARRAWSRFGDWKIHRSAPPADYRWRMVVTQPDVMWIMACLADSIDYSNFKGRIASRPDQSAKLHAYHGLWCDLSSLQPNPEIGRGR